jgi:hypothetical protein
LRKACAGKAYFSKILRMFSNGILQMRGSAEFGYSDFRSFRNRSAMELRSMRRRKRLRPAVYMGTHLFLRLAANAIVLLA